MNSKLGHLNQHHIGIMKLVIISLVLLTLSTQIIVSTQYPGALEPEKMSIAFFPAYATLFLTYIPLSLGRLRLAAHVFLLGMVIHQFLIMVNLTGPVTYVYVSYTNVVLIAGIVLGPHLGLLYTALVVSTLSLYFWLARLDFVDQLLLEDIAYGKEIELLATIACLLCTGLTIFYSVFKMEKLYKTALEEKDKADKSYQAMTEAQFANEMRARYGAAIGALSKQIVQFSDARDYIQVTAEEIQEILCMDIVLILLPKNQRLHVKSWSVLDEHNDVFTYDQELPIELSSAMNKTSELDTRALLSWLRSQNINTETVPYSFVVPLIDVNDHVGYITVFCKRQVTSHMHHFLKTISGILTSSLYRTKAEEQLRQSQKMEAIGLLAGGISHDFNNLLTAILGNAEVAKSQYQSEVSVRTHLNQIIRASNQAASLTHKLLTLSKKSVFRPAVIDVNEVLLEMEPMLKPLFVGGKSLTVQPASKPANVFLDQKNLENILLNLIINAKDALDDSGSVEIIVSIIPIPSKKSTSVRIEVIDNGCGMRDTVRENVFEPFFTTKSEGTGLGLTMVQSIVQQGNGEIQIRSVEDEGTCFVLLFPHIARQESRKPVRSNVIQMNRKHRRQTILVVDDNNDVRQIVQSMINSNGYTAIGARGGRQALEILEEQQIDLILSDSIMPGINGQQLFDRIQEAYPKIPFVIMTGFSNHKEFFQNIPVLEKPISLQMLIELFEHLLPDSTTSMSG